MHLPQVELVETPTRSRILKSATATTAVLSLAVKLNVLTKAANSEDTGVDPFDWYWAVHVWHSSYWHSAVLRQGTKTAFLFVEFLTVVRQLAELHSSLRWHKRKRLRTIVAIIDPAWHKPGWITSLLMFSRSSVLMPLGFLGNSDFEYGCCNALFGYWCCHYKLPRNMKPDEKQIIVNVLYNRTV